MKKCICFILATIVFSLISCNKIEIEKVYEPDGDMISDEVSLKTDSIKESVFYDKLVYLDKFEILKELNKKSTNTFDSTKAVFEENFDFGEYLPVVTFDTISKADGGYYNTCAVLNNKKLQSCTEDYYRFKKAYGQDLLEDLFLFKNHPSSTNCDYSALKEDVFYDCYAHTGFFTSKNENYSILESKLSFFEIETESGRKYAFTLLENENFRFQLEQVLEDRYYVISIFYVEENKFHNYDHTLETRGFATYLYDIEEDTLTLLEKNAINPSLSPDRKYLIYTGQTKEQKGNRLSLTHYYGVHDDRGFFVKNLETSKTVFYEYGNEGSFTDYRCINWIEREKFTSLMENTSVEAETENTTEKFFANIKKLPPRNDDLKTISLSLPDDFPLVPYKVPEFTSPENFEFGDYMLNVTFSIGNLTASSDFYTYSFLGEGVNNIDEGREVYDKFNEKYLIKSPITNYREDTHLVTADTFTGQYLYNSRVVDISTDGKKVVTTSLIDSIDSGTSIKSWYDYYDWNEKNDYYENGKLVASETTADYFNGAYNKTSNLPLYSQLHGYLESDGDYIGIQEYGEYIDIYSVSQDKWVCRFLTPSYYKELDDDNLEAASCEVIQILDDRYLLLDMAKAFSNAGHTYSHCTYLYDMESDEYTYLGNYLFHAVLSPDKKYLGYSTYVWDYMAGMGANNLSEMEHGYFILNLENGETVFYPNKYAYQEIVNWVSKDAIYETINFEGSYVDKNIKQREEITLYPDGDKTVTVEFSVKDFNAEKEIAQTELKAFNCGEYLPFTTRKSECFLIHTDKEITGLCSKISNKIGIRKDIVYISEAGDKVGVFTQSPENEYVGKYELFDKNLQTVFNLDNLAKRVLTDNNVYEKIDIVSYIPPLDSKPEQMKETYDIRVYYSYLDEESVFYIYNSDDVYPSYVVKFPLIKGKDEKGYDKNTYYEIDSCNENGDMIVYERTIFNRDSNLSYSDGNYYYVNLKEKTVMNIGDDYYNLHISPDGNYIYGYIESEPDYKGLYMNVREKNYLIYDKGKDLVNWVKKDSLVDLWN